MVDICILAQAVPSNLTGGGHNQFSDPKFVDEPDPLNAPSTIGKVALP